MKKKILLRHFAAVSFFLAYEIITLIITGITFNAYVLAFFYIMHIVFFYSMACFFLPLLKTRIKSSLCKIILSIIIVVLYGWTLTLLYRVVEVILIGSYSVKNIVREFGNNCWRGLYFYGLAIAFWYSKYTWGVEKTALDHEAKRHEAEEKEMKMEASFLRSQINPHQLFNTLTVVYTRLLSKAPEEARTILILSDMMEYALENGTEDGRVDLAEDLAQLDRELKLQNIFYDSKLPITYSIDLAPDAQDIRIPPMLFIGFVQNIFKHGNLHEPISISISIKDKTLHFQTSNTIAGHANAPVKNTGLVNARARLEKHFSGRFFLITTREDNTFLVDLKINL